MRLPPLFVLGFLTATANAQLTAILPASADGVAGSTANAFPWGSASSATWGGLRIMCLYDSAHFLGQPAAVTAPILITSIRWRANDTYTSWTGGTYSTATVALATAAVDHIAASTVWASNVGPDYTVVHSGPVTVQPGTGAGVGVPGPYIVEVPVVPPFLYDPNQGDLVVDTDFLAGAWGGGSFVPLDVQAANLLARRVYASSMYPNANGVDTGVPVIEVGFVPAGAGTFATNTTLGDGCNQVADVSSYELFSTSAAFDLANSAISLLHTGDGYLAVPGVVGFVPPSAGAQVLTLANNAQATVTLSQPMPVGRSSTTSSLVVCSNGFISAATGNLTSGSPSPTTLLHSPKTWWSLCWHDFDPSIAGSGAVKFEQIGNIAYVTWDGVWDAAGTSPASANTMQAQFDVTSGTVHYVYGATSTGGNARLVGFSEAGSSADPGSMDISAALPGTFSAATFRLDPLTLTRASRPVLGTSWNLDVTNVPATGTIGVDIFGLSDPGLTDLSVLGLPGCGLRASLDFLQAWVVTGTSHAYSLPVPNSAALVNFHVFTNSAVFQPNANAFGAITSNGVDGKLGDL